MLSVPFSPVITLPKNPYGRDIAVGDIHGMWDLLKRALRAINFNARSDRLFCTGDLVDKGIDHTQFARWVNLSWFHPAMGNHDGSIAFGDDPQYANRGLACQFTNHLWYFQLSAPERAAIAATLAKLPLAIEIETDDQPIVIVHAGLGSQETHWPAFRDRLNRGDVATVKRALWDRSSFPKPEEVLQRTGRTITGARHLIHGHNIIKSPQAETARDGNRFYIDTGAYKSFTRKGTLEADSFDLTLIDVHNPAVPLYSPVHRPEPVLDCRTAAPGR